jgi:hypothetical protein
MIIAAAILLDPLAQRFFRLIRSQNSPVVNHRTISAAV